MKLATNLLGCCRINAENILKCSSNIPVIWRTTVSYVLKSLKAKVYHSAYLLWYMLRIKNAIHDFLQVVIDPLYFPSSLQNAPEITLYNFFLTEFMNP